MIIFTCSEVIKDDSYKFSDSGMYYTPKHGSYDSYLDYFRSLPLTPHPEVITFCVTGVGLILIKNIGCHSLKGLKMVYYNVKERSSMRS